MQLRHSILKAIAYFDVFEYPLLAEEILYFLDQSVDRAEFNVALKALLDEGCLYHIGGFYSLRNEPALAVRRVSGNHNAQKLLAISGKGSRLLFRFPFVRGVGISGSLSKNFADKDADIDYFIITSPNRLWIARTLMHGFKKLSYLTGRQDRYCMNYYVDEEALKIQEKNIFTAIELITLMPVCGNGALVNFFDANDWVITYFPNYASKTRQMKVSHPNSWLKNSVEWLLDNALGDRLDNFLMRLTSRRWNKKTGKGAVNKKGDRMSMQTDKHFSKPDPSFLQARVITFFNIRMQGLEAKWPDYFAIEAD